MVDAELLKSRLLLLAEYIEDLKEAAKLSMENLLSDKKSRRYVERTLQLAIEACLDIGGHLIADLRLREPEHNRDIFIILIEMGYLPAEMKDKFIKMAGFRNIIVHDYTRIDPELVYGVLQSGLHDLEFFAQTVQKTFLQNSDLE